MYLVLLLRSRAQCMFPNEKAMISGLSVLHAAKLINLSTVGLQHPFSHAACTEVMGIHTGDLKTVTKSHMCLCAMH